MNHHIRHSRIVAISLLAVAIAALVAACGGDAPATQPTAAPQPAQTAPTAPPAIATAPPAPTQPPAPAPTAPAPTAPTAPTTVPAQPQAPTPAPASTAVPTMAPAPADTAAPPATSGSGIVLTLQEGSMARYKVEEVLAGTGFKVATGETSEVSGTIALDADGGIVDGSNAIVVQAASLMSDSDRRDGYVRRFTLRTSDHPEIVFRPTSVDGLPSPIGDASGSVDFTITGDLTILEQTREVVWDASAEFAGDTVSGSASTEFTFEHFDMDKPSVAIVLSVEDTIRLEIDFVAGMDMPAAMDTGDAGSETADDADAPLAVQHVLGDSNAPVTVVEYGDFQ